MKERERFGIITNKDKILLNSIGTTHKILDIDHVNNFCCLKGLDYFSIPMTSVIELKKYRKEKLKAIL